MARPSGRHRTGRRSATAPPAPAPAMTAGPGCYEPRPPTAPHRRIHRSGATPDRPHGTRPIVALNLAPPSRIQADRGDLPQGPFLSILGVGGGGGGQIGKLGRAHFNNLEGGRSSTGGMKTGLEADCNLAGCDCCPWLIGGPVEGQSALPSVLSPPAFLDRPRTPDPYRPRTHCGGPGPPGPQPTPQPPTLPGWPAPGLGLGNAGQGSAGNDDGPRGRAG